MEYRILKNLVESVIKPNGNNEITGQIMQDIIMAVINAFGTGFQFIGVADDETEPTLSDGKQLYLCGEGDYTNFGEDFKVEKGEIGFLTFDTEWHLNVVAIDLGRKIDTADLKDESVTVGKLSEALQGVLSALVAGYTYQGIADSSTNPSNITIPSFYLTKTSGTYTHFLDSNSQAIVVPKGINILMYDGDDWSLNTLTRNFDFINVNDVNSQATAYANAAAARAAVPVELRKLGLQITYLLENGWFTDQFIGNDITDWSVADNWKVIGPVNVPQNTKTGGYDVVVGNDIVANIASQRDINDINGWTTRFDSLDDTLQPIYPIKQGQIIDDIQGATSLGFLSDDSPSQYVVVNSSDLPVKASRNFVYVKTHGTGSTPLTNVSFHIQGKVETLSQYVKHGYDKQMLSYILTRVLKGNTLNLLSPYSNVGRILQDSGEIALPNSTYTSYGPINVISGHSYRLYHKDMTTSFNGLNAKIYNNGAFVNKQSQNNIITVPQGLSAPVIYLTNYVSNPYDFEECMFVDVTNGEPTAFIPYYLDRYLATMVTNLINSVQNINTKAIFKEPSLNLFNPDGDILEGGFYDDSHVWTANSSFNTILIPLQAGHSYTKYIGATPETWNNVHVRVFDGDTMIAKTTDLDRIHITVPANAVNPIGAFGFYNETSPNYIDIDTLMVVDSAVVVAEYMPYGQQVIIDETFVREVNRIIEQAHVQIELEQTTGTAVDKAMSQNAITNAIVNAIAGLSSMTLLQSTGQSTTNAMSQKSVTDALAELWAAITGEPSYRFAERPANGYENFLVDVDCGIADDTTISDNIQDARDIKQDRCILVLPINYSRSGEPVRLVICGHGTGWRCTAETTIPWAGMNTQMLINEGYAVLGCNGTPGELDGLAQGHNAVPECYRSILAAYKYVTEKYNIKRDGVFTAGLSMGTYMTGQIPLFGDIPVLAQVMYSFSGEIWKAQFTLKADVRQRMCEKFGFTGTPPVFTTQNPPSTSEKEYILNNFDKWSGYDVLIKGLTNKAILDTFNVWPASSTITDNAEAAIYNDAIVVGRPPVKFFVCDNDTTAPKRWSEYMVKMIRNGGGYAELRHYATGGHNSWGVGNNITFTTKYGGSMTVNGSSYEGLLFLERFDK